MLRALLTASVIFATVVFFSMLREPVLVFCCCIGDLCCLFFAYVCLVSMCVCFPSCLTFYSVHFFIPHQVKSSKKKCFLELQQPHQNINHTIFKKRYQRCHLLFYKRDPNIITNNFRLFCNCVQYLLVLSFKLPYKTT